jgi:hypothetical protein
VYSLGLCTVYSILYYTSLSMLPKQFPKSFTYGESTIVLQSTCFIVNKILLFMTQVKQLSKHWEDSHTFIRVVLCFKLIDCYRACSEYCRSWIWSSVGSHHGLFRIVTCFFYTQHLTLKSKDLLKSCVWVERHIYLLTVVSVN